jgi:hypothetical protein
LEAEVFHNYLIEKIQAELFPNSQLRQVLRLFLQSNVLRNERLEALKIADLRKEATDEAEKIRKATTELENAAKFETIFAEAAKSSVALKIASEFSRPAVVASTLLGEAQKALDANAIIALDAVTAASLTEIPDWLKKAVEAGRVVFFGARTTEIFPAEAFVGNPAELEEKVKANRAVERVAILLTPDQMRAHFPDGYGLKKGAVLGKDAFVAPLNKDYSLELHLTFANELLQVEFDMKKLSDAGRLLLGLQLESLHLSIGDMRNILNDLGQTPTELIRDGKEELKNLIRGSYLPALKA